MKKSFLTVFVLISLLVFNGCRNADKKVVPKEVVVVETKVVQEVKNDSSREVPVEPVIEILANAPTAVEGDKDGDGIPDYVDSDPTKSLQETIATKGFQNLIILDNMKVNSDQLTPVMLELLDVVSEVLKTNENLKIRVIGHTCDLGTDEYNLQLSKKRALAAEKYLLSKGTIKGKIKVEWKGESEPVVKNRDEKSRSKNRRVQIMFYENENKAK